MEDADLEQIRKARLEQLKAQSGGAKSGGGGGGGGGGNQGEQRKQQEGKYQPHDTPRAEIPLRFQATSPRLIKGENFCLTLLVGTTQPKHEPAS
ncbi:hypothetical protein ACKVWC_010929 [Pyricularia oryzae]